MAPLQTAGPDQVSFLDNRRTAARWPRRGAGAVIVHPDLADRVPATSVAIVTDEPYLAWAKVAALFHPLPPASPGAHPSAIVAPDAVVDPSAEIGPLAVIGARARDRRRAAGSAPHALIGDGVVMGRIAGSAPHASVSHALLGARVYVYPGARIGQEGFGFAIDATGFLTVPQLGRVILEDDVEIGANSTVDRGSAQDTVIGAGSRLDNLVQIGHNVRLGPLLRGGGAGRHFRLDRARGFRRGRRRRRASTGHLRIGQRARIGAQAGVMADIEAGHGRGR